MGRCSHCTSRSDYQGRSSLRDNSDFHTGMHHAHKYSWCMCGRDFVLVECTFWSTCRNTGIVQHECMHEISRRNRYSLDKHSRVSIDFHSSETTLDPSPSMNNRRLKHIRNSWSMTTLLPMSRIGHRDLVLFGRLPINWVDSSNRPEHHDPHRRGHSWQRDSSCTLIGSHWRCPNTDPLCTIQCRTPDPTQ